MNIFKAIGRGISNALCFIVYIIAWFFCKLFLRCKIIGKQNLNKDNDKIKMIVSNHMQVYGPTAMHIRFPLHKKAVWINEKMMDRDKIEHEMGLAIYDENNYKWAPKWLKKFVIKISKNLVYFVLKYKVHGISISRDNRRELINTFKETLEYTDKGYSIVVFPEVDYQDEGIGEIFSGFASYAKFAHKKNGKITEFYPVYIDGKSKRMYIGKPIDYNPENADYDTEVATYIKNEINNLYLIAKEKHKKKSKKNKKDTQNINEAENIIDKENLNENENNINENASQNNTNENLNNLNKDNLI